MGVGDQKMERGNHFHCFGGSVDDIQHKILSFMLSDILLWTKNSSNKLKIWILIIFVKSFTKYVKDNFCKKYVKYNFFKYVKDNFCKKYVKDIFFLNENFLSKN